MSICARCGKETKSDYRIREYGLLCADCAGKDITTIMAFNNQKIKVIQAENNELSAERNRLKQLDCDHNFTDTGCSDSQGFIYQCKKCGITKISNKFILEE